MTNYPHNKVIEQEALSERVRRKHLAKRITALYVRVLTMLRPTETRGRRPHLGGTIGRVRFAHHGLVGQHHRSAHVEFHLSPS